MQKHEDLLLALLAATVNHDTNRCCALLPVDTGCWERVLALAEKHGVTGLVFSCMEKPVKWIKSAIFVKNII